MSSGPSTFSHCYPRAGALGYLGTIWTHPGSRRSAAVWGCAVPSSPLGCCKHFYPFLDFLHPSTGELSPWAAWHRYCSKCKAEENKNQERFTFTTAKLFKPNKFVLSLLSGKAFQNALLFQAVVTCLLTCAQGQAPRRNNNTRTFSEKPSINRMLSTCLRLGMCSNPSPKSTTLKHSGESILEPASNWFSRAISWDLKHVLKCSARQGPKSHWVSWASASPFLIKFHFYSRKKSAHKQLIRAFSGLLISMGQRTC